MTVWLTTHLALWGVATLGLCATQDCTDTENNTMAGERRGRGNAEGTAVGE